MRVAVLTREFPPYVYGGAGVHVDHLVRELRPLVDVEVLVLGAEPREGAICVRGVRPAPARGQRRAPQLIAPAWCWPRPEASVGRRALAHLVRQLSPGTSQGCCTACHTCCHRALAGAAAPVEGRAARRGLPAVVVGRADAYEAANGHRRQPRDARGHPVGLPAVDPARVQVVHNGIDTDFYRPVEDTDVLERLGIDPSRPSVVFVGRITRQKGSRTLLPPGAAVDPEVQIVLLAGSAGHAGAGRGDLGRWRRSWPSAPASSGSRRCCHGEDVRQVLTHATTFVCPSIYEPLGIVNLEAMAARPRSWPARRRHPGGRPARRHGPARAVRPAAVRRVRDGPGCRHERPGAASGPRPGTRPGRSGAGGRGVRLGPDRSRDGGGLPQRHRVTRGLSRGGADAVSRLPPP
jgi:alpha-maltose-1-phosphate synthase